MVHARAAALKETPERRVRRERREQLQTSVAVAQQRRIDTVAGEHLTMDERGAELLRVQGERRLEFGHGNANVIDSLEHR
jgi:hypothetical protein